MEAMKEQFVGKDVQVYPGDTYKKYARVLDINEAGVTFIVTKAEANTAWPVGIHFISFSANLKFVLV